MNQSTISIINGKIILTRYYEYVDKDDNGDYAKMIGTKQDELYIATEGFEVLYEEFNLYGATYNGWIKNAEHIFFVGNSYKGKTRDGVIVKKTSIKKTHFADAIVIDKFFLKTKTEVFYTGKKIRSADAASFRKIVQTDFYEDDKAVYAYTITNGLSIIDLPKTNRYFIPYCWYFADENNIYQQSSWSEKIETVSGGLGTQARSNVLEVLTKNNAANNEKLRVEIFHSIKTYEDIFTYFFPKANTNWNTKKSEGLQL